MDNKELNIKKMIDDYTSWIKKEISVATFGEYTELTVPFVDRFNHYLQIYVKQNNDGTIEITDDGYIINNLITSGISFKKNSSRYKALHKIAKNFNVSIIEEEITTTATEKSFPIKKHMIVQAMLAIDDLFVITPSRIKDMFADDIATHLDANDIFYSRDFSLLGKTETIYTYDFHIQRTQNKPERFCNGINKLDLSKRDLTLQRWQDTQEKRGTSSELIVIYNDDNKVSNDILKGFHNYGIKTIPFSEMQNSDYLSMLMG